MPDTILETVVLYAATKESLALDVETSESPTSTPPAFSITPKGARAPGEWVDGTWHPDGWNAATRKAVAITPAIGAQGQLIIAECSVYDLWIKVELAGEEAAWKVGTIDVA